MTEDRQSANVRSFRVTDEVMGRFKEIQDEMRLTQDSALKMLVDAYELEKAKNTIPDRETEIANFQSKAGELVEAYLHSLQLNQDAETRVRAEVQLQLQSKDKVIADLQDRNEALKENLKLENERAEEAGKLLAEGVIRMNEALNELDSLHATIKDKQRIIDALEKERAGYEALSAEAAELKAWQTSAKEKLGLIQDQAAAVNNQLVSLEAKFEAAELQHEKDVELLEARHKNALKEAENDKRQAVLEVKEEAQRRFEEYEKQRNERIRELETKISELLKERRENDLKES